MEFIDSIKSFLTNDLNFLNLSGALNPAVYILLFGSIVLLVLFFIALGIRSASKGNKFRKHLEDTAAFVNAGDTIDENNVEELNARIQSPLMARAVAKGWGAFLDQQTGYPSDYISENEVFGDRKNNPDYKGGKGFFAFFGAVIVLLCALLAAIGCIDTVRGIDVSTGAGVAAVMEFILPVIGAIAVPLIVYVILLGILGILSNSLLKSTTAAFRSFQDALDTKVIIFRETQDEFITENIEEINAAIEDIIASKLGDSEILEIVTTPEIDEELAVPEEPAPVAEEPAPAPAPEPAPAPVEEAAAAEEPAQTKEQLLLQLVYIADAASKDPDITADQLIELAQYLEEARANGDYNDEENEIFDACMIILSGTYYERFEKKEDE